MKKRFIVFNDNERDYLRMALRQFADLYFDDISNSEFSLNKYMVACQLLFELASCEKSSNPST